jgi:hypothetical protein
MDGWDEGLGCCLWWAVVVLLAIGFAIGFFIGRAAG